MLLNISSLWLRLFSKKSTQNNRIWIKSASKLTRFADIITSNFTTRTFSMKFLRIEVTKTLWFLQVFTPFQQIVTLADSNGNNNHSTWYFITWHLRSVIHSWECTPSSSRLPLPFGLKKETKRKVVHLSCVIHNTTIKGRNRSSVHWLSTSVRCEYCAY